MLIVYLHSDLYSVYTHVYVYHSSGAYRGLTVGSVEWVAAQDHRDSRVDKYWQHLFSTVESTVNDSFEQSSGQIYKSLSTVRSMAYEAYKKFTQFNTFSHFIALCTSPYPTQRGQYARPTPWTDQYFTLFCIYWSFYSSLELPQASWPWATLHTLTHIRILTLYQAAGPICLLRYKALNTHMDHRLLSLAVSILLAVTWYVIYVWLLTRAIGSLSGSCI